MKNKSKQPAPKKKTKEDLSLYDFLLEKASDWVSEKYKGIKNYGSDLKNEFEEDPDQTVKDVIMSLPRGAAHLTKGMIDIPLSAFPKARDKFDRLIDDMDEAYIETTGVRPNSAAAGLGKLGATLTAPAVKTGNILATGAANSVLYGAADRAGEGASMGEIAKGAPKDAAIGTLLSYPGHKIAKRMNQNTDIMLENASRTPEKALELQSKVRSAGGNLSLGHALNEQGLQESFERMNMPGSGVKRDLRRTKGALNKISKEAEKTFPNEARELGQSLQKGFEKVKSRSSDLYRNAEDIPGAIEDLVLSPDQLDKAIRSTGKIKNAPSITQTPEFYGLTSREGDKVNKLLKAHYSKAKPHLQRAWNQGNPTPEYFEIYRKSGLPNYLDLQDYYHDLNRYASKHRLFEHGADWKAKNAWNAQIDPIKSIIEETDRAGKFQKANHFWRDQVLPYKQEKEIWKANKVLSDSERVSPTFDLFMKEGNTNAEKIFGHLSTKDKRRVLGMAMHQNRGVDTPFVRNTYRQEKKLPSYITNSSQGDVKKLVEEVEDLARLNTNYSQIQSALKSKGSSADVGRASRLGISGLLGSAGDAAVKTGGTLLGQGVYQNLRRRYLNSPKTLKKYLNPELLQEMRTKKAEHVVEQLIKAKYYPKNRHEDQKNRS